MRMPRLSRRPVLILTLLLVLVCFFYHPRILLGVAVWNAVPNEFKTLLSSPSPSVPNIHADRPTSSAPTPVIQDPIHTAIWSFMKYDAAVSEFFNRKRSRFDKLSDGHRSLADTIGYSEHFQTVQSAVDANANLTMRIAEHAKQVYNLPSGFTLDKDSNERDIMLPYSLVNDAFGHLVRDWSEESHAERAQMFPPILNALEHHLVGPRGEKKVLLPGFGLGRLAHEIANRGYAVEACELDYSAILAYHYILNCTHEPFEHTFYPYVTHWVHQLNATQRFQPVRIPDILPSHNVKLVEGDFLKEFTEEGVYDAIVTLFFIDMSENIIDFLETIKRLLKVGGLWVNLGPFKWTPRSKMQLSAEETMRLSDLLGLQVDRSSHQAVETTYAHQPESLLKFTYVTQFWTAKKLNKREGNEGQ